MHELSLSRTRFGPVSSMISAKRHDRVAEIPHFVDRESDVQLAQVSRNDTLIDALGAAVRGRAYEESLDLVPNDVRADTTQHASDVAGG